MITNHLVGAEIPDFQCLISACTPEECYVYRKQNIIKQHKKLEETDC